MAVSRIIILEKRILFDAAIAAVVGQVATKQAATTDHLAADHGITVVASDVSGTHATSEAAASPPLQVLAISSAVKDASVLAAAANSNTKVVVYDATSSLNTVIQAIEMALNGQKASSIAFANEGSPDQFLLTRNVLVDQQTLTSDAGLRAFWTQVGALVKDGGRVDFLSCDLTQNDTGTLSLLDTLLQGNDRSHVVNVAASTDPTGNPQEGGNWILETGGVNAGAVYFNTDQLSQWDGVLTTFTVTTTADSGTGSLRAAITAADAAGGTSTIAFNIAGSGVHTIGVKTVLPTITANVTIDGSTQPGYSGSPLIVLTPSLSFTDNGLTFSSVTGGGVNAMDIGGFNQNAIELDFSSHITISNNYIGVQPDGVSSNRILLHDINLNDTANSTISSNLLERAGGDGIDGAAGSTGIVVTGNTISNDSVGISILSNFTIGGSGGLGNTITNCTEGIEDLGWHRLIGSYRGKSYFE